MGEPVIAGEVTAQRVLEESEQLAREGEIDLAADTLEDHLQLSSHEPALLSALGRLRMQQGRSAEAIPLFREALRLVEERRTGEPGNVPTPRTEPSPTPVDSTSTIDDADIAFIEETDAARDAKRPRFQIFEPEQIPSSDEPSPVDAKRPAAVDDPAPRTRGAEATTLMVPGDDDARDRPEGEISDTPSGGANEQALPTGTNLSSHQSDSESPAASPRLEPVPLFVEQLPLAYEEPEVEDLLSGGDEDPHGFDDTADEGDSPFDVLESLDTAVVYRPSGPEPVFDWSEIDAELEVAEFDEAPSREEFEREVKTDGRLSRWERAYAVALEVGLPYDWPREGIELLAEVFHMHWWSSARRSMERELAAGMTPEELRLAMSVREIWRTHPEFSTDLTYVRSWAMFATTRDTYAALSWPQSLALVRSYDAQPDEAELESLLERLHDSWSVTTTTRRTFPAFHTYVWYRTTIAAEVLPAWMEWTFEPDPALGLDDDAFPGAERSTTLRRDLERYGLLPQHEDVYHPLGLGVLARPRLR